jgi:hypothetical protein
LPNPQKLEFFIKHRGDELNHTKVEFFNGYSIKGGSAKRRVFPFPFDDIKLRSYESIIEKIVERKWKVKAFIMIAESEKVVPYRVAIECEKNYGIRRATVYKWIHEMGKLQVLKIEPARDDIIKLKVKVVSLTDLGKSIYEDIKNRKVTELFDIKI